MEFVPLAIDGVFGIISESNIDSRGFLVRVWDKYSLFDNFNLDHREDFDFDESQFARKQWIAKQMKNRSANQYIFFFF